MASAITVKLTSNEAVILLGWLERVQMTDLRRLVGDPAAWAPICKIAGALGKALLGIFVADCAERMDARRAPSEGDHRQLRRRPRRLSRPSCRQSASVRAKSIENTESQRSQSTWQPSSSVPPCPPDALGQDTMYQVAGVDVRAVPHAWHDGSHAAAAGSLPLRAHP